MLEILEPGTKIGVLTSDETWVSGIFQGILEEAGQEWYVVDTGIGNPRRINAGFVLEITVGNPATVSEISKHPKFNLVRQAD